MSDDDMISWDPDPLYTNYSSLTYNNFHVTVQNSDGNNVVVILDGSVTWGFTFTLDSQTGDFNYKMIFYGSTSGTIDGESFKSFTIDLKYTATYNNTDKTFSGSIVGTVDNQSVNTTFNYTTPAAASS